MARTHGQIGRLDRADLQSELRRHGLRATASRLAVLETLRTADSPSSHGEVADVLASHGWDRTTIYRNLLDLTRVGLARRLDLGDHIWRFEPTGERAADEGLIWRFVCSECGDVSLLRGVTLVVAEGAQIPASLREEHAELQVRAHCDACVTPSEKAVSAAPVDEEPAEG